MGSVRTAGGRYVTAGLSPVWQSTLMETDPLNWSTRPAIDILGDPRVSADGQGSGGGGFTTPEAAENRQRRDAPRDRSGHAGMRPTVRAAYWAVVALVAAALVAAVVVAFVGHGQLRKADSTLATTRSELRHTLAAVAAARTELLNVTGRADVAGQTLTAAAAQLATDQTRLAQAQADQFYQGVSINQLDLCLAGVEQSLNQIALGNTAGAAATLEGVAANCRSAEPTGA
jgi:hypothetical protein